MNCIPKQECSQHSSQRHSCANDTRQPKCPMTSADKAQGTQSHKLSTTCANQLAHRMRRANKRERERVHAARGCHFVEMPAPHRMLSNLDVNIYARATSTSTVSHDNERTATATTTTTTAVVMFVCVRSLSGCMGCACPNSSSSGQQSLLTRN